jgi:signal peptidase I
MSKPQVSNAPPRRRWIAALLSVPLGGGLGQIYTGRPFVGLTIICLAEAVCIVFQAMEVWPGGTQILALFGALGGLFVFALASAVLSAGQDYRLRWYNRWYLYPAIWVAVSAFNYYVLLDQHGHFKGTRSFSIPSAAMEPTLQIGDRFIAATSDKFRVPVRGMLVIYRPVLFPATDYIKRVIGLPGDVVEIKDNRAIVNGAVLDEPYARLLPLSPQIAEQPPVRVPEDMIYVLGDNRGNSFDSRLPDHGLVPIKNIVGRASAIFYARDWSRIGSRL